MFKNIIFDLDGTLTDPKAGIVNGLRLAFGRYGIRLGDEAEYESFIGPSLRAYLPKRFPELPPETCDALVLCYRTYYGEKGKFENTPYPGITGMLDALRAAGLRLAVATSKPKVFAVEILEHFGLLGYFEYVAGPPIINSSSDKSVLILECLEALGASPEETVMVGDRAYDVDGARKAGLPCVAVTYGYGNPGETDAALCRVSSPAELTALLTGEPQ